VLDYGRSAASLLMPQLLGDLNVEVIATNAFAEAGVADSGPIAATALEQTARLTVAVGADLGIVMDNAGERIWLLDEFGRPIDPETTLLMFVAELSRRRAEGTLVVPVTETRLVEQVAGAAAGRVERTDATLRALLARASRPDVLFAGASGGGYVFPELTPSYDAVMSVGKTLEVVAHAGTTVSALVADLPRSTRIQRTVPCPWSRKGAAMRRLIESVKGMEVDTGDGVKVFEGDDWVHVVPDPDEPLFHVYAEAGTVEESEALEAKYRAVLEEAAAGAEPEPARTLN